MIEKWKAIVNAADDKKIWTRCPEVDRELLLIRETGKRGRGKYPDGFRQEEYSLSYHKADRNVIPVSGTEILPLFNAAFHIFVPVQ